MKLTFGILSKQTVKSKILTIINMKESIQVDVTQIPTLIERLNQLAQQNKDTELGQSIWNYLQFIDGMEHDSELYFGIQAFCQRNEIDLEDC